MKYKKQTIIGLITIVAIILLYVGINVLKGVNILKATNYYYAKLEKVSNLNISSPVLFNGYKVGTVKAMDFDYETGHGITLTLNLDNKIRLPEGTYISLAQTPLSGAEIILSPGPQGFNYDKRIEPGATLPTKKAATDIVESATNELYPALLSTVLKIDTTLTALTRLSKNPDVMIMLEELRLGTQSLNRSLQIVEGTVGKNLNPMIGKLNGVLDDANKFTSKLEDIDLTGLNASMQNLESITKELKIATDQLNKTDNTLGYLLHDNNTLYHRIDSLMKSADFLIRDIQANPKRYVRLSLF